MLAASPLTASAHDIVHALTLVLRLGDLIERADLEWGVLPPWPHLHEVAVGDAVLVPHLPRRHLHARD